jgi:outer membrane protein assembly factor BamD (BamD/ComL family)
MIHGWRWFLLPVCAASLTLGCQGLQPAPAPPTPNSGVEQASAVQPLSNGDDLHRASPIAADDGELDDEDDGKPKEDTSGFDWSDLDPENIYKNVKAATGFGPDKKIAQQLYKEGDELYRAKRYADAAAKFKSAAGRWPDSTLEENALFYQAESYFFADNYPDAHDTFAVLLKKYDNTRHLDKVVLREFTIGQYWEKLQDASPHWPVTPNVTDKSRPLFDTFGNAIKAYETVALHDPTGPLADDSLMAIANGYFVRGRYQDAVDYYDRLRKEYPNSKHQVQAHLLSMKSKEMIYQGPLYDETPLKEAGEVADTALTQFGPRLGDERDNVAKTRDKFRAQTAERGWAMAKYYEDKRAYGGARYYYKQIVKDYPNTEMGRAAQKRLEEIKDFPDRPPNHFKFLTDLFPDK